MTNEELKTQLSIIHTSLTFEEGGEWINAVVPATEWKALALHLRRHGSFLFDYLFCLTCVDWKSHLTMVYHLTSTTARHSLVVKAKLDRNRPEIPTVADIWRTAEFHEREVFELFGVNFTGHPDLRLLILPDGWEGRFPMRKDYDDPINMIKL